MAHTTASQSALPVEPNDFSKVLLEVSLTGFILFRPVFAQAESTILDLTYEHLNPAAQRMLQLTERPAETFLTLYPTAQEEGIFAFYCAAFASGQTERYQVNYQHDGLDGYFHLVARRSGELLVVSFTDTNDQPRSAVEEALRQSQAHEQQARRELEAERRQLHAILTQLPAQVATYHGPDYVYDFVNARYQAYFPHHTFVGLPLLQTVPDVVTANGLLALFEQVYQTGEPYHNPEQEVWLATHGRAQPQQYFLSFTLLPLRDVHGQIKGLLDFSYDVTAQVQARQQVERLNQELEIRVHERTRQLNEQQDLLQQILRNVPAYLATLSGPEHRYSFFNDHYQELGAGRLVLGRSVAEVSPEAEVQGFVRLLDQVYASGVPFTGQEVPLYRPAPGPVETAPCYLNFVYQPLTDKQGLSTGILIFAVDVTEQVLARHRVQALNQELATLNEKMRDLNQELHHSNTRLVHTNADLDNFIYTASHDLKSPISNIEGLLLLLPGVLPEAVRTEEPVRALLDHMQEAVERFKRTIAHLTEVGKLQAEFAQPAAQMRLVDVLEDVRRDLPPSLIAGMDQLEVNAEDCQPRVFSSKNLRSILYNLLSNALKYRHPDRLAVVRVVCLREGDNIVLTVQDNGLGINEQQQTRLFGLFQRLHTHVEGTGVGLYMVKRIVENAGGTVSVQSQEDIGTLFTLTFPA